MEAEYLVVRFLVCHEFAIVPKSWVWINSDEDAAISYPEERAARTRRRVKNNEPCSEDWNMFRVYVIHYANSYKEARKVIQRLSKTTEVEADQNKRDDSYIDEISSLVSNMSLKEPDETSLKDNKEATAELRNSEPIIKLQDNSVKDLNIQEYRVINNDKNTEKQDDIIDDKMKDDAKETDDDTWKENKEVTQNEDDIEKNNVKLNEKIDFDYKYPSPEQTTHDKGDTPKDTLRYPNFIELVPESNVFIEAEKLEKCKSSSNNRDELVLSLMRAIFTNDGLVMCLLTITEHSSQSLNKNILKAIVTYVKELKGGKWDNSPDKKVRSKVKNPYLTKLVPESNVLVNAKELLEAVSTANGSRRKLACSLMRAVFTKEALMSCSLDDDILIECKETRPELDKIAKEAILKFVEKVEDDEKNRWNPWDRMSVLKAMYYELEKWRLLAQIQKIMKNNNTVGN